MEKKSRILITGAGGLIGRALSQLLADQGYEHIFTPSRAECDFTDFLAVKLLFTKVKPDYVFHLAATVYGIMGNMQNKGRSFFENIMINTHIVEASRIANVKKIVAMGTGAMYPYPSPGLPLQETMVWSGRPHGAEDSYAQAKRAMLSQLEAYKENYNLPYALVISSNLYGPHDKFDPECGHVTPALVRKFYEARQENKKVSVWGNGSAQRDFLYSVDAASALCTIMDHCEGAVNMGSGVVHSIADLVSVLGKHLNMEDQIEWDASKPNGQDYRAYDLSKLQAANFKPQYDFADSIRLTYDWYASNALTARK